MTIHDRGDPWRANRWGTRLLLLLAVVAGGMDAVTFLSVGHTFVSNQTGNVLLLAMDAAGDRTPDAGAAVVSLVGFVAGAALAGRLLRTMVSGDAVPRGLLALLWGEGALVLSGAAVELLTDVPEPWTVGPLAVAMGMQTTLGYRIVLPYLTPGIVTGTIVTASMRSPAGDGSQRWSRHAVVAVAAFSAGAALGTLLVGETTGGAIAVFGALVLAAAAVLRRRPAER
jgi:uncharacterized membrane protein YoaK (UPF0700 family)